MNFYQQHKRLIWVVFVPLLLVGIGLIILQHVRPDSPLQQSAAPTVPAVDSARVQLQVNVQGANNTVITTQQNAQGAYKTYEDAKKRFDTLRLDLP